MYLSAKYKIIRKALASILVGAFLFNDTASYALAPGTRMTSQVFKEACRAECVLLAGEAANEYIEKALISISRHGYDRRADPNKITEEEVAEFRDGGKKELCDLPNLKSTSRDVEGQKVLVVSIPGYLKNMGHVAHEGLGRINGFPVVWVDSNYYYDDDVIMHALDEVWQYEKKRHTLPDNSYQAMRDAVEKDPQIARDFHEKSRPLDTLYDSIRNTPGVFDMDAIYAAYLKHGLAKNAPDHPLFARDTRPRGSVNVAAAPGMPQFSSNDESEERLCDFLSKVKTTNLPQSRRIYDLEQEFYDLYNKVHLDPRHVKMIARLNKRLRKADDVFNPSGQGIYQLSDMEFIVAVLEYLGVTPDDSLLDAGSGKAELLYLLSHIFGIRATGIEVWTPFHEYAVFLGKMFAEKGYIKGDRINLVNGNFAAQEADFSKCTLLYYYARGATRKRELLEKMLTVKKGCRIIIYGALEPEIECGLAFNSDFKVDILSMEYRVLDVGAARIYTREKEGVKAGAAPVSPGGRTSAKGNKPAGRQQLGPYNYKPEEEEILPSVENPMPIEQPHKTYTEINGDRFRRLFAQNDRSPKDLKMILTILAPLVPKDRNITAGNLARAAGSLGIKMDFTMRKEVQRTLAHYTWEELELLRQGRQVQESLSISTSKMDEALRSAYADFLRTILEDVYIDWEKVFKILAPLLSPGSYVTAQNMAIAAREHLKIELTPVQIDQMDRALRDYSLAEKRSWKKLTLALKPNPIPAERLITSESNAGEPLDASPLPARPAPGKRNIIAEYSERVGIANPVKLLEYMIEKGDLDLAKFLLEKIDGTMKNLLPEDRKNIESARLCLKDVPNIPVPPKGIGRENAYNFRLEFYYWLLRNTVERYKNTHDGELPTQTELAGILKVTQASISRWVININKSGFFTPIKLRRPLQKKKVYVSDDEIIAAYSNFVNEEHRLPVLLELSDILGIEDGALGRRLKALKLKTAGMKGRRGQPRVSITDEQIINAFYEYKKAHNGESPNADYLIERLGVGNHATIVQRLIKINLRYMAKGKPLLRTRKNSKFFRPPKGSVPMQDDSVSLKELHAAAAQASSFITKLLSNPARDDKLARFAALHDRSSVMSIKTSLRDLWSALNIYARTGEFYKTTRPMRISSRRKEDVFCDGSRFYVNVQILNRKSGRYADTQDLSKMLFRSLLRAVPFPKAFADDMQELVFATTPAQGAKISKGRTSAKGDWQSFGPYNYVFKDDNDASSDEEPFPVEKPPKDYREINTARAGRIPRSELVRSRLEQTILLETILAKTNKSTDDWETVVSILAPLLPQGKRFNARNMAYGAQDQLGVTMSFDQIEEIQQVLKPYPAAKRKLLRQGNGVKLPASANMPEVSTTVPPKTAAPLPPEQLLTLQGIMLKPNINDENIKIVFGILVPLIPKDRDVTMESMIQAASEFGIEISPAVAKKMQAALVHYSSNELASLKEKRAESAYMEKLQRYTMLESRYVNSLRTYLERTYVDWMKVFQILAPLLPPGCPVTAQNMAVEAEKRLGVEISPKQIYEMETVLRSYSVPEKTSWKDLSLEPGARMRQPQITDGSHIEAPPKVSSPPSPTQLKPENSNALTEYAQRVGIKDPVELLSYMLDKGDLNLAKFLLEKIDGSIKNLSLSDRQSIESARLSLKDVRNIPVPPKGMSIKDAHNFRLEFYYWLFYNAVRRYKNTHDGDLPTQRELSGVLKIIPTLTTYWIAYINSSGSFGYIKLRHPHQKRKKYVSNDEIIAAYFKFVNEKHRLPAQRELSDILGNSVAAIAARLQNLNEKRRMQKEPLLLTAGIKGRRGQPRVSITDGQIINVFNEYKDDHNEGAPDINYLMERLGTTSQSLIIQKLRRINLRRMAKGEPLLRTRKNNKFFKAPKGAVPIQDGSVSLKELRMAVAQVSSCITKLLSSPEREDKLARFAASHNKSPVMLLKTSLRELRSAFDIYASTNKFYETARPMHISNRKEDIFCDGSRFYVNAQIFDSRSDRYVDTQDLSKMLFGMLLRAVHFPKAFADDMKELVFATTPVQDKKPSSGGSVYASMFGLGYLVELTGRAQGEALKAWTPLMFAATGVATIFLAAFMTWFGWNEMPVISFSLSIALGMTCSQIAHMPAERRSGARAVLKNFDYLRFIPAIAMGAAIGLVVPILYSQIMTLPGFDKEGYGFASQLSGAFLRPAVDQTHASPIITFLITFIYSVYGKYRHREKDKDIPAVMADSLSKVFGRRGTMTYSWMVVWPILAVLMNFDMPAELRNFTVAIFQPPLMAMIDFIASKSLAGHGEVKVIKPWAKWAPLVLIPLVAINYIFMPIPTIIVVIPAAIIWARFGFSEGAEGSDPQTVPGILVPGFVMHDPEEGSIGYGDDYRAPQLPYELSVIPHGLTWNNMKDVLHGCRSNDEDSKMTPEGRDQVIAGAKAWWKEYGEDFKKDPDKYIFVVSPLVRAQQTLEIYLEHIERMSGGIKPGVVNDPEVREADFGVWDGQKISDLLTGPDAEFVKRYLDLDVFMKPRDDSVGTAESFMMLLCRVYGWIMSKKEEFSGKKVFVVGHGTWMTAASVIMRKSYVEERGGAIDWLRTARGKKVERGHAIRIDIGEGGVIRERDTPVAAEGTRAATAEGGVSPSGTSPKVGEAAPKGPSPKTRGGTRGLIFSEEKARDALPKDRANRSFGRSVQRTADKFLENGGPNRFTALTMTRLALGFAMFFAAMFIDKGLFSIQAFEFASICISLSILRNIAVDTLSIDGRPPKKWKWASFRRMKLSNDLLFGGLIAIMVVVVKKFGTNDISAALGAPFMLNPILDILILSPVGGISTYFARIARRYPQDTAVKDMWKSFEMSIAAYAVFIGLYFFGLTDSFIPSAAAFLLTRRIIGESITAAIEYPVMKERHGRKPAEDAFTEQTEKDDASAGTDPSSKIEPSPNTAAATQGGESQSGTFPASPEAVDNEIARAALRLARRINEQGISVVLMSYHSGYLPYQLFIAAWNHLYEGKNLPRIYILSHDATRALYWPDPQLLEKLSVLPGHECTGAMLNDIIFDVFPGHERYRSSIEYIIRVGLNDSIGDMLKDIISNDIAYIDDFGVTFTKKDRIERALKILKPESKVFFGFLSAAGQLSANRQSESIFIGTIDNYAHREITRLADAYRNFAKNEKSQDEYEKETVEARIAKIIDRISSLSPAFAGAEAAPAQQEPQFPSVPSPSKETKDDELRMETADLTGTTGKTKPGTATVFSPAVPSSANQEANEDMASEGKPMQDATEAASGSTAKDRSNKVHEIIWSAYWKIMAKDRALYIDNPEIFLRDLAKELGIGSGILSLDEKKCKIAERHFDAGFKRHGVVNISDKVYEKLSAKDKSDLSELGIKVPGVYILLYEQDLAGIVASYQDGKRMLEWGIMHEVCEFFHMNYEIFDRDIFLYLHHASLGVIEEDLEFARDLGCLDAVIQFYRQQLKGCSIKGDKCWIEISHSVEMLLDKAASLNHSQENIGTATGFTPAASAAPAPAAAPTRAQVRTTKDDGVPKNMPGGKPYYYMTPEDDATSDASSAKRPKGEKHPSSLKGKQKTGVSKWDLLEQFKQGLQGLSEETVAKLREETALGGKRKILVESGLGVAEVIDGKFLIQEVDRFLRERQVAAPVAVQPRRNFLRFLKHGRELIAYSTDDFEYVVKMPLEPNNMDKVEWILKHWIGKGYELARERLNGLAVPTMVVDATKGSKKPFSYLLEKSGVQRTDLAIIQKKVVPILDRLVYLAKEGKIEEAKALIDKYKAFVVLMFRRGVVDLDFNNPYCNYGIDLQDGNIYAFDFGDFAEDEGAADRFLEMLHVGNKYFYDDLREKVDKKLATYFWQSPIQIEDFFTESGKSLFGVDLKPENMENFKMSFPYSEEHIRYIFMNHSMSQVDEMRSVRTTKDEGVPKNMPGGKPYYYMTPEDDIRSKKPESSLGKAGTATVSSPAAPAATASVAAEETRAESEEGGVSQSGTNPETCTISTAGLGTMLGEAVIADDFPEDKITIDGLIEFVEQKKPEWFSDVKTRKDKIIKICLGIESIPGRHSFKGLISTLSAGFFGSVRSEKNERKYERGYKLCREAGAILWSKKFRSAILPKGRMTARFISEPIGLGYEHIYEGWPPYKVKVEDTKKFLELCIHPERRKFVGQWERDYAELLSHMSARELCDEWKRLKGYDQLYINTVSEFIGDTAQHFHPCNFRLKEYVYLKTSEISDKARIEYISDIAKVDIYLEWASRHWGSRPLSGIRSIPRHIEPNLDYIRESITPMLKRRDGTIPSFEESVVYRVLTTISDEEALKILGREEAVQGLNALAATPARKMLEAIGAVMPGENTEFTRMLENFVNDIRVDREGRSEKKLLDQPVTSEYDRLLRQEIVRMHVIDYIHTHAENIQAQAAQPVRDAHTIKMWEGYADKSQECERTNIRKWTAGTSCEVSFDSLDDLIEAARNSTELDENAVMILPLNDKIEKALQNANAHIIFINLPDNKTEAGADKLVNLQGLIATGEAYLDNDEERFYRLYNLLVMTPAATRLSLAKLKADPAQFINTLNFILRPITVNDPEDQLRLRKRLEYLLEFA